MLYPIKNIKNGRYRVMTWYRVGHLRTKIFKEVIMYHFPLTNFNLDLRFVLTDLETYAYSYDF